MRWRAYKLIPYVIIIKKSSKIWLNNLNKLSIRIEARFHCQKAWDLESHWMQELLEKKDCSSLSRTELLFNKQKTVITFYYCVSCITVVDKTLDAAIFPPWADLVVRRIKQINQAAVLLLPQAVVWGDCSGHIFGLSRHIASNGDRSEPSSPCSSTLLPL